MTEGPRKKSRRVHGRPPLDENGMLTDEAIEEFAREMADAMRKAFWDEETTEDSGRIDPNENPDDFEVPPPDYELMTYDELQAEAKRERKRRSKKS